MARISFSALVEEVVGKLAGSVFQDSYGGFQIRTRVTPRNPQTKYQQLRRGEFGFLSATWRNLTSIERQTFIDAALTPPAALNLYLQSNVNLTLIEEPTITDYVTTSDPGTMVVEFVSVTPSEMIIQATGATTTVPAGTKLLVQVTDQKPPTRIFTNPSMYSPVISFDAGTDLSGLTDIFTEWTARYGVLMPDKRLCIKTNLIDKSNGLRGADSVNCTNSEIMATKFIPLSTFSTDVATVGTGIEDLYTYTLPANTLANDTDSLRIVAAANFGGLAVNKELILAIGSSTISFAISATNAPVEVLATVIRTSVNTARVLTLYTTPMGAVTSSISDLAGLDFTTNQDIILQGQASATGVVTATLMTIDLVKAP